MKRALQILIISIFTAFFLFGLTLINAEASTLDITERVSLSTDKVQGNDESLYSAISADGRFVAFESVASNLVPGDTNGESDIFLHDRQTGQTQRVSVSTAGEQGNNWIWSPSISADGRYIAFWSNASNLVNNDTNRTSDVFVHDRVTGETTRVSVSSDGQQGDLMSGYPYISASGQYVVFAAFASNLVANDTNGTMDVFVHDRQTGSTTRASISSLGVEGNN